MRGVSIEIYRLSLEVGMHKRRESTVPLSGGACLAANARGLFAGATIANDGLDTAGGAVFARGRGGAGQSRRRRMVMPIATAMVSAATTAATIIAIDAPPPPSSPPPFWDELGSGSAAGLVVSVGVRRPGVSPVGTGDGSVVESAAVGSAVATGAGVAGWGGIDGMKGGGGEEDACWVGAVVVGSTAVGRWVAGCCVLGAGDGDREGTVVGVAVGYVWPMSVHSYSYHILSLELISCGV